MLTAAIELHVCGYRDFAVCSGSAPARSCSDNNSISITAASAPSLPLTHIHDASTRPYYPLQLVESFNNLIQYQYESNAVLIYSIIRRRDVFEHLATVSVSSWKADNAARLAKRAAEKATKSGLSKAQKQAAALAASGYNASTALTDGAPGSPSKQGQPLSPAGTGLVPAAAADAHAGGTVASSSSSSSSPARERGGSSASVATVGPGGSGTNEEWASKRNEQLESSASAPAPVVAAAAPAAAASSASTSAAAGGHGGGWAATDEWFDSVRSTLPLAAIQRLCGYLSPLVEEFIRKRCVYFGFVGYSCARACMRIGVGVPAGIHAWRLCS